MHIAMRMYTTAAGLVGGKELCSILNEAVRAALSPFATHPLPCGLA